MLPGALGLLNSLICGGVFLHPTSFALAGRVCCLQEETFLGMQQKPTQFGTGWQKKKWDVMLKVKQWRNQVSSAPSNAQQKQRELIWASGHLTE